MDNSLLVNTLSSSSLATLLVFFLLWLCKKKIIGWFEKDVSKDIERYKHELETKKELIKHDLEVEVHKVKYLSANIQQVYPEIYKALISCEGDLSYFLNPNYEPDWLSINTEQLESILRSRNIANNDIARLVDLVKLGSPDRGQEISRVIKLRHLHDVESSLKEARNFYLLKKLFISNNLEVMLDEIFDGFWSTWIDLETWYSFGHDSSGVKFKDIRDGHKKAMSNIVRVEKIMREELFPSS